MAKMVIFGKFWIWISEKRRRVTSWYLYSLTHLAYKKAVLYVFTKTIKSSFFTLVHVFTKYVGKTKKKLQNIPFSILGLRKHSCRFYQWHHALHRTGTILYFHNSIYDDFFWCIFFRRTFKNGENILLRFI